MKKILFSAGFIWVVFAAYCAEVGATPMAYSFTGEITSTYTYGVPTDIDLFEGDTFAGIITYDNEDRGIRHISFTFDNADHNTFDSLVSELYGGGVWNIGSGFVAGLPDDVTPGAFNELYMAPYQNDGSLLDSIYDMTGSMRMEFRRFVDGSLGELSLGMQLTTAAYTPVPEPATLLLFGAGLLGFVGIRSGRKMV